MWRRLKDRHDALVRDSAAAAGGQVVKALGDGFLVVFPAEEPAIRFAIATQRAVRSEPWDEGVAPEIRIGMDTGPALYRSDPSDFEGDAVNVASHICSRARPGEVLLSARAYYGALPWLDRAGGEVKLEPVGEVRLKGLPTLEALYRAWAPGLREEYPPLTRAGNLASHLGPPPFIDREAPLGEILEELERRPVVTLLGPGGYGEDAAGDGSRAAGGDSIPGRRLGDAAGGGEPRGSGGGGDTGHPRAGGRCRGAGRGAAPAAGGVAGAAHPGQRRAVSGRGERRFHQARGADRPSLPAYPRALHLADRPAPGDRVEARVELQPLDRPAPRATVEALKDCPSAQLCAERLRLRVRQFALNSSTAPHVAAICQATEGIPLLIELAAGQLGRRTLPEIARDVARVLVDPSRDADRPDRHRDLVRLLDWSLDLLGEERDFFLRLGVFRGGFDAAAAAAVTDEPQAEEFLQRLMDAHLVMGPSLDDYLAEQPRYRLLNATATYCRSRLGDDLLLWRRRHAAHYGEVARTAGQEPVWDDATTGPRATAGGAGQPGSGAGHGPGDGGPATRRDASADRSGSCCTGSASGRSSRRARGDSWTGSVRRRGRRSTGVGVGPLPHRAEAVARMALAQAAHDAGQMVEARETVFRTHRSLGRAG